MLSKDNKTLCGTCKYTWGNCPAKDNYHNAIVKGEVVSCTKHRFKNATKR